MEKALSILLNGIVVFIIGKCGVFNVENATQMVLFSISSFLSLTMIEIIIVAIKIKQLNGMIKGFFQLLLTNIFSIGFFIDLFLSWGVAWALMKIF